MCGGPDGRHDMWWGPSSSSKISWPVVS